MSKILIVDDEIGIRELLSEILEDEGYGVLLAENAEQARKLVSHQDEINLILLDIWMPDTDGITLLKEWVNSPQKTLIPPVIMMSGHGTIDTAVEATKIGAISFLEKPISKSWCFCSLHPYKRIKIIIFNKLSVGKRRDL